MSMMDPGTGNYPAFDDPPAPVQDACMPRGCTVFPGKRVYRYIDAPDGCSFYWDQPQIAAAVNEGGKYQEAAMRYVKEYLAFCRAKNGVLLWGNHYYFDPGKNSVVKFLDDKPPEKIHPGLEQGELHELRPLTPAWELFWEASPEITEGYLRTVAPLHLFDSETGAFNRHADAQRGCAFLESNGILVETLCWLYTKTGDRALCAAALRLARYSYANRDLNTGLIENNPTSERWDKYVSTTECGLWAGSLLRAAKYSGIDEFAGMASGALDAYLAYGWDKAGKLYGRLFVKNGEPDLGPKTTPFQPGAYSSALDPLFPAHDYPYSFMETCLALFQMTKGEHYRRALERWLGTVEEQILDDSAVVYAEHYGRAIHLALKAEREAAVSVHRLAERIGRRAIDSLFSRGMFMGHHGARYYNCVDGVGYLLLALQYLQSGEEPPLSSPFF
jgi:hypothetical protein